MREDLLSENVDLAVDSTARLDVNNSRLSFESDTLDDSDGERSAEEVEVKEEGVEFEEEGVSTGDLSGDIGSTERDETRWAVSFDLSGLSSG